MNGTQYGAYRVYEAIAKELEEKSEKFDEATLDAIRFAAQVAANVYASTIDAEVEDWQEIAKPNMTRHTKFQK